MGMTDMQFKAYLRELIAELAFIKDSNAEQAKEMLE